MTTTPYVSGARTERAAARAARALLQVEPLGTEVVLYDEEKTSNEVQTNVASKLRSFQKYTSFPVLTRTKVVDDRVLGFVRRPANAEELPLKKTQTVSSTQVAERRRKQGRPTRPVAQQLEQVLNGHGGWVTVTNRSLVGADPVDAVRLYESRRAQLLNVARKAGVQIETKVRHTDKTIWIQARRKG